MPKIWVLRGIKKGVLTTGFPRRKPTPEETAERCEPPVATANSDWVAAENACPTGAIRSTPEQRIELGKCIYCQRCANSGFIFGSSNESRVRVSQAELTSTNSIEALASKQQMFKRSFHVLMIDVGSCNACNLEVLNLSNPYYDLTRLGIFFTNSPKHADALIVVGALNKAMVDVLKRTYESIPEPKFVISVGACAVSGGVFQKTASFVSPVQDVIPVDVIIPGCPPSPIQILEGLLLAIGRVV